MVTAPTPLRGEIWLIDFDPAVGAEIRKIRPGLVVGLDTVGRLPAKLVVPITDWKNRYTSLLWHVMLIPDRANGLLKRSTADAFQTKSVSVKRFIRKLGTLADAIVEDVADAIALCVGVS